jgi:sugar phosphate permease
MALSYVAVYLCRKNLSVAIPMMIEAKFVPDKATAGIIASWSTFAYMLGKFASGPLVDRAGGRRGLLGSLAGVALFGALGGFAPGLAVLAAVYSANRLFGAGGWGSIMKLTSSWVPATRLATAIAALSLSYVFGDVAAKLFAGMIASLGGDWRAVMSVPAVVMLAAIAMVALTVRQGPLREVPADELGSEPASSLLARPSMGSRVARLFARPQFRTICLLSFTLTLMREAFGTWSVDFLKSLQVGAGSVSGAALGSIWFDLAGAVPILLMGALYDRIQPGLRRWVIAGILLLLTCVLGLLTTVSRSNPGMAVPLLGAVGLLLYGPYSVLGGVVAVESGGTELSGTASGIVDGIGYLAAILAGQQMGQILDLGGYPIAFSILAGLTLASSVAAVLGLKTRPAVTAPAG